jgi:hypothetical protein
MRGTHRGYAQPAVQADDDDRTSCQSRKVRTFLLPLEAGQTALVLPPPGCSGRLPEIRCAAFSCVRGLSGPPSRLGSNSQSQSESGNLCGDINLPLQRRQPASQRWRALLQSQCLSAKRCRAHKRATTRRIVSVCTVSAKRGRFAYLAHRPGGLPSLTAVARRGPFLHLKENPCETCAISPTMLASVYVAIYEDEWGRK